LSVAPVFGLCFSRHLCALVILFLSATLPGPYPTLMTTPRPTALLFLRSLILAVVWIGAVVSVQAAPVVSNLAAAQRAGTKLVDISYDLAAPGFGSVAVTLEASSDGGVNWTVPVASATGAVGESVAPGTGKAIVWNAGVDWLGNYSTQMRFRVVAEDGFSYIPGGSFAMGRDEWGHR
jgi:hypothetical protein